MAVAITRTADVAGVALTSLVATYSSVSIGAATSDRIIVVACDSFLSPLSATIDSGSGFVAMSATTGAGGAGSLSTRIFYLTVSSGTTATIKITYTFDDTDGSLNHVIVYRVTGGSDTLNSSGTDTSADVSSDPLTTGSRTVPTGGGLFVSAALDSGAVTWASATEDIDLSAGGFRYTAAIRVTTGTVAVTCTNTAGAEGISGVLSWIIFNQGGVQAGSAGVFGTGNLTAGVTLLNQQISARFVGAGSLRAALTGLGDQFGSARMGGVGSFRADTTQRKAANIRFGAVGDFQINVTTLPQIRATFRGSSTLTVETLYFPAPLPPAPAELVSGEWPEERLLPQCPILNGFSEQRQRNAIEFQPDVGFTKLHRRATESVIQTSVTFRMTDAEVDTFNEWYVDYQEDGTLDFTWDHPVTKVNHSWMFDAQDAPRIERMTPDTFRVSFNLLRLD